MNTSGDAAEQIVRLTLEGYEVVLKITGSAAKNIAAFLLYRKFLHFVVRAKKYPTI